MLGPDEIHRRLGYHPATEETGPQHANMREAGEMFLTFLDQMLPDGRAKSTAATHFQTTLMWANFAIAEQAPVEPKASAPE
jgi:hypothetical protein